MIGFYSRAILALFIFLCGSSAYGQTKVVVIPLGGDDAPPPTVYAIGDTGPGGGIVFHVTNGGLNGLEAAPFDQALAPWGCQSTNVVGVDDLEGVQDLDSNSGAVNTPLVAVACGGAAAVTTVYVWPNGQRDGFLPNKQELNLLYLQKEVVGGFVSTSYWSSSEHSEQFAWYQFFGNGGQQDDNKPNSLGVRAVRAF